jgi:hypothetical protein
MRLAPRRLDISSAGIVDWDFRGVGTMLVDIVVVGRMRHLSIALAGMGMACQSWQAILA